MEIKNFTTDIDKFLEGLEEATKNKIAQLFDMLEMFGSEIGMPYSKSLGDGLFEFRVFGKIPVRIIYCFHEGRAILLHAFVKKTYKISLKDLDLSRKRRGLLA
mgnify:CR=1 FL=1